MSSKAFYMAMMVIVATIALVFSSAMGFEMLSDNMRIGIVMGVVGATMLATSIGGILRRRELQ